MSSRYSSPGLPDWSTKKTYPIDYTYGQHFDPDTGIPIGDTRYYMQFCTSNSQCVEYKCCHHGTFQTLNQKTGKEEVIQASACNEEIFCREDDIALVVVIAVFVWAGVIVLVNCCRECMYKNELKKEIDQVSNSEEHTFEN